MSTNLLVTSIYSKLEILTFQKEKGNKTQGSTFPLLWTQWRGEEGALSSHSLHSSLRPRSHGEHCHQKQGSGQLFDEASFLRVLCNSDAFRLSQNVPSSLEGNSGLDPNSLHLENSYWVLTVYQDLQNKLFNQDLLPYPPMSHVFRFSHVAPLKHTPALG